MTRIFVFEFVTGGGLLNAPCWDQSSSLLREGTAMLRAICDDLARLPTVQVELLMDHRVEIPLPSTTQVTHVTNPAQADQAFGHLLQRADEVLVIAPEIDGVLERICGRLATANARQLGPAIDFVRLASNKLALAKVWEAAGVPTPNTLAVRCERDLQLLRCHQPVVIKPYDGAGSSQVHLLAANQLPKLLDGRTTWCVQDYHAGHAASVAALCYVDGVIWLPPCWQLCEPPSFAYRGGRRVTDAAANHRILKLASQAMAALPTATGYVGIDLVLGESTDGSQDVAIEINPRLTTSFVGLQQLVRPNLSELMRATTRPEPGTWWIDPRPIEFDATGNWCWG